MSRENIEAVRSILDAYNRGDFDAMGTDPDFVLVPPGGQSAIKGADGVRAWMEPEAFESQVIEPLEFRVAEDKVVVRQRSKIRGAGSGIEIDFVSWGVWTFSEPGHPVRLEVFPDHEKGKALEAAGLSD